MEVLKLHTKGCVFRCCQSSDCAIALLSWLRCVDRTVGSKSGNLWYPEHMVTLPSIVKRYPFVNRFDTDQHIIVSHRLVISEESNTRDLAPIHLFICGGLNFGDCLDCVIWVWTPCSVARFAGKYCLQLQSNILIGHFHCNLSTYNLTTF
jgi:hypothetical protein